MIFFSFFSASLNLIISYSYLLSLFIFCCPFLVRLCLYLTLSWSGPWQLPQCWVLHYTDPRLWESACHCDELQLSFHSEPESWSLICIAILQLVSHRLRILFHVLFILFHRTIFGCGSMRVILLACMPGLHPRWPLRALQRSAYYSWSITPLCRAYNFETKLSGDRAGKWLG